MTLNVHKLDLRETYDEKDGYGDQKEDCEKKLNIVTHVLNS